VAVEEESIMAEKRVHLLFSFTYNFEDNCMIEYKGSSEAKERG